LSRPKLSTRKFSVGKKKKKKEEKKKNKVAASLEHKVT